MTPIAKRIEMAQKLLSRPHRSAMRPRAAAPTPPVPTEKPKVSPEASPTREGKIFCPITVVRENDAMSVTPARNVRPRPPQPVPA